MRGSSFSDLLEKAPRLARGKPCMVRIPGYCDRDLSKTVGAHIRRGGVGGFGLKPPHLCLVWACHTCHAIIDGRMKTEIEGSELDTYILEGLCRTLEQVCKIWSQKR